MGGTYVDSAMYHSWLAKAMSFLKLFLEDDNELIKGMQKSHRDYYFEAATCVKIIDKDFITFEQKNKVDVEGRIGNPSGLMADLNNQHEGFATVIIKPDM